MGVRAFPIYIGLKLTRTEKELLDKMVARENTTTSGFIRELIMRESAKPLLDEAS